jgi:hypothetical protein
MASTLLPTTCQLGKTILKKKNYQLVMMVGQATIVGLCMKNEDLEPCPY